MNHDFDRELNIIELLQKKSFFLFGPRGVGKSWLIRNSLVSVSRVVNLLETDTYTRFLTNPAELRAVIESTDPNTIVVIDEIQKVPALLDEVHLAIEEQGTRFLLTGSSARKLRRDSVNLLAGRARRAELFPLTTQELKDDFDLSRYLLVGGLPAVYSSDEPLEDLKAYVDTYLREEVAAEALVRKLPAFARFLKTVALCDGQIINYSEVGSDAQVAPSTVREYFGILEDTLLGFTLPAWKASKKRKAIQTGKFFLFDPGVGNTLRELQSIPRSSDLFGLRFEQFIGMELRAYLSYRRSSEELTYWRSVNGQEVDFLVGEEFAVEVKSTKKVSPRHRKGLVALKEEGVFKRYYLVSHDPLEATHDEIIQIHWEEFLRRMWDNDLS